MIIRNMGNEKTLTATKVRRLFVLCMLCVVGLLAFAQQDYTSYVVNYNFEKSTPISVNVYTYEKDIPEGSNDVARLQEVDGWSFSYNDDASAGAVFAYGSTNFLGAADFLPPPVSPDGGEGKALGIAAVWQFTSQYKQDVTLPAGKYVLTLPVFNSKGGTNAIAQNYMGVIVDYWGGYYASTLNYEVDKWTYEAIAFDVPSQTTVTFSLGYTATNIGSAYMPHLFVDKVDLKKFDTDDARNQYLATVPALEATANENMKTPLARINLANAIATAEGQLNAPNVFGEALFQINQEGYAFYANAISQARAVLNISGAQKADFDAAISALDNAASTVFHTSQFLNTPSADKKYTIQLNDGECYMSLNEGTKLSSEPVGLSFVAMYNEYYAITNGTEYVAWSGPNSWDMNTSYDAYEWKFTYIGDGYYTIAKAYNPSHLIGVDDVGDGAWCYANKGQSDKSLWKIEEVPHDANYTDFVGGADFTDGTYWSLEYADGSTLNGVNGQSGDLRLDTWSSRGDKDGSNMTPPFMEYYYSNAPLQYAKIRHSAVTGLPEGIYQLSMKVRCYAEKYNGYPPTGVTLYANGVETKDFVGGQPLKYYNTGAYTLATPSVIFTVGADGTLDFGLNVAGDATTNMNWVAWKDVTLLYLGDSKLDTDDYYLRNRATGTYLQAGGNWGTQAVLGEHGSLIKANKLFDGVYTLETEYANGSEKYFLGATNPDGLVYMEYERQEWTISPTGDGAFTIYQPSYGYLGTEDGETTSSTMYDGTSAATQWEFVSYRNRVKGLIEGMEHDATFLISNPRFDRNFNNSLWEGNFKLGGGESQFNSNQVAEVWDATIDVKQVLTNIPNGRYQVTMQGFYRYNDTEENTNNRAIETHEDGTEELLAMLYAQSGTASEQTPIQSIASEDDLLGNLPFSMDDAGRTFASGYYSDNKLTIDVTNNTLSIGIRKTEHPGKDWTVWDNFELTLLEAGDNTNFKFEEEGKVNIDFSKASPDNPVDCTALIKNADLNNAAVGWSGSLKRSSSGNNRMAEYGGSGVAHVTFDIYQNIKGVPNGIYRLSAKGFYRYGDVRREEAVGNNVYATTTIPYAIISRRMGHESLLAKLYANNMEVGLPSIFEGAKPEQTHNGDYETEFGWVPNSTASAIEAFEAGDYGVELMVPVVNGQLLLGVKKTLGYKYDWTCFDDFKLEYLGPQNLVYATDVNIESSSISIATGETRQLTASVVPATASDTKLRWWSLDPYTVSCTEDGVIKGVNAGRAYLYVGALGSEGSNVVKVIDVTVSSADGNPSQLTFNEIQVSNLDMFVDPSNNYGGYVEFYNKGTSAVSLYNLYLTDDPSQPYKFRLNSQTGSVPAKGHAVIWFDHSEGESGNYSGNANFTLDMDGGTIYLFDQGGTEILRQAYPFATSRTSYARKTDGTGEWAVTAYPTPGKSNAGSKEFVALGSARVPAPAATPGTGFYTLNNLAVSVQGEGTIYCTIDGTLPTEINGVTPDKLPALNGPTVLKLRAFQKGKLPSEVVTYIYAEQKHNHTLPVLMIAADPKDLYSDELGVFVTGTNGKSGHGIDYPCNWTMDWDRDAQMELLDKDGNSLFRQEVNLSRFGGWSRSWFPYNFKVKAQKQYEGNNYFEYPFFTQNKPYLKHKALQVRNGGNDVFCRIKDASLHQMIIRSGFYVDCLDYQPVHCYINGRYCGMQNLREPSNKHYGLADYGIDTDEMDALEFANSVTVKAGTSDAFWQWSDLSYNAYDDYTYQQICNMVDVDEFANYFAAELFLGGDDWPQNNCKGFKGNDGKYHIVLFDVDQAFRNNSGAFTRLSSSIPLVRVFQNMLANDTFRKKFIDSFCLFGGSVMQVERCHTIIDEIAAEMNPALALEGLSTSPTAEYMKQAISKSRHDTMIKALKNWYYARLYNGEREFHVKFSSNIDGAKLQLNGINVPLAQFDGTLFAPSVLTASAPEGYTFKGWKTTSGRVLSSSEKFDLETLNYSEALYETLEMQAVYEPLATDAARIADIAMPVKVNEISAGNTIFAAETWKRSDWIELYNMTDQPLDATGLYLSDDIDQPLKFQIVKNSSVANTIIPANGHLLVWADDLGVQEGQTQLHTSFKLSNSDNQHVVVVSSSQFVENNQNYFRQHPDMTAFIDVLKYDAHRGDETVGRYPDGGKKFYRMGRPTIERTNTLLSSDKQTGEDESFMSVFLNEFTLELTSGWNWASHILADPIKPTKLSSYADNIVGRSTEVHRSGTTLTGTLKSLEAGNLYKVQMSQADTFYSLSDHCDASMPISLTAGWNWIGYTANGVQTVAEALAGYKAEEGDKIVGQDGFAIYSDGQWTGSLSTIETGKGYQLYTTKTQTLKFRAPSMSINLRRSRLKGLAKSSYGVDKYAYPDVMGVVGILQQNDMPVDADRFTLLANVDGECRGAGQWLDGKIFLTTYGEAGEDIKYFALDELDGTLYPVVEELTFATDVKGTLKSPVIFNIGEKKPDDTGIDDNVYSFSPRTTVAGYYNLSGLYVGGPGTTLQKGIYIVKYQDGSFKKIYVKP